MPVNVPVIKQFPRHYLSATQSKMETVTTTGGTINAKAWIEYYVNVDTTINLPDATTLEIGDRIDVVQIKNKATMVYLNRVWEAGASSNDGFKSARAVFKVVEVDGTLTWTLVSSAGGVRVFLNIVDGSTLAERTINDELLRGVDELIVRGISGHDNHTRGIFFDTTDESTLARVLIIIEEAANWTLTTIANEAVFHSVEVANKAFILSSNSDPFQTLTLTQTGEDKWVAVAGIGKWFVDGTSKLVIPFYYS